MTDIRYAPTRKRESLTRADILAQQFGTMHASTGEQEPCQDNRSGPQRCCRRSRIERNVSLAGVCATGTAGGISSRRRPPLPNPKPGCCPTPLDREGAGSRCACSKSPGEPCCRLTVSANMATLSIDAVLDELRQR